MADDKHPASPLEALNARGLTAKREYVHGLEQRHDAEALSLLTECLCDESWFLRDLAEQAFYRLGEEHASHLLPMLAGGLWYTRLSAARLLGRIGYRPAVPALLQLCDDTNETVALAAREAVVAVARQRGATRVAHALYAQTPERRRQRIAEIAERDRAQAKNIERLMANVDLMAESHPDQLLDPLDPAQNPERVAPAAPRRAAPPGAPRPQAAPKSPASPGPAAASKAQEAPKAPAAPRTSPAAKAQDAPKSPVAPKTPAAPKSHAAPKPVAAAPRPAPPGPPASPQLELEPATPSTAPAPPERPGAETPPPDPSAAPPPADESPPAGS